LDDDGRLGGGGDDGVGVGFFEFLAEFFVLPATGVEVVPVDVAVEIDTHGVLADAVHRAAGCGDAVAGGFDALLAHLGVDHAGVPAGAEFLSDQRGEVTKIGFEFYCEVGHLENCPALGGALRVYLEGGERPSVGPMRGRLY